VQGRIGHGHTADEHRRQLGYRRQLAGTSDLHVNAENGGELLLRRVFMRHRPARLAADKAHFALQRQAVDLVHHAINVVGQAIALLADGLVKRY